MSLLMSSSRSSPLLHPLTHKVEESKLASRDAMLVDKATSKVTTKDGSEIVIRYLYGQTLASNPISTKGSWRMSMTYPLNNLVQPNLLQQNVWQSLLENRLPKIDILPEIRIL